MPGSPPAGLTLREPATTLPRIGQRRLRPAVFIAAANAATPAPLSSTVGRGRGPEALTPASPASSGGDARVVSSADGMHPSGNPTLRRRPASIALLVVDAAAAAAVVAQSSPIAVAAADSLREPASTARKPAAPVR